ncbi:MAG: response regulator transcription factor [Prevotella sp.]|nr:response regulator transcription factor [Hoylesella loescheii]MCI6724226.1 response regulator transcription factor [Bacteroidales bacterium]MDY3355372.1 response regulator transcription factor [Prevotella sp.]MCI7037982.1 response regulator transcription factor [Bacteroidales bacterium]MCI7561331.1 response regulator transcription factor [Bacteroidales bacterium]
MEKTKSRILVVDDEQDLCDILQYNLETEGYIADTANSAEEALLLPLTDYDLILLDVMMGEMSGFQMARRLKSDAATACIPIIFITALDSEDHTVRGLDIGADDYIAKPLSMKEVMARVKAVLRRTQHIEEQNEDECIVYDRMRIDDNSKTVTIDGKDIQLTKIEYKILALLVQHSGKVFSREDLLRRCWPTDTYVLDRTVDVNITRLRKKIGEYGKQLKTRFGYGYTFEK